MKGRPTLSTSILKTALKRILVISMSLSLAICMVSCGETVETTSYHPEFDGLEYLGPDENGYADQFMIHRYSDGYAYVNINEGQDILLIPEGGAEPEGVSDDVVVVTSPVDNIYMAATSAMALFAASDALDNIGFSSIKSEDWAVDAAREAMDNGAIVYAGKYSAPDYEMLIGKGCRLAIESTMIYHTPEVKDKLEELGIPVIIERSSYESHPLGRTEWIKVYGLLTGKEEEAKAAFDEQASRIGNIRSTDTCKTVAFFYINSRGNVVTYKAEGYVPEMIRLAGGEFMIKETGEDESRLSSLNMGMEDFFAAAQDADILIYNSSIVGELDSMEQFLKLSPVLADFEAVKTGNVWCTSKSLFQETDKTGSIIEDMNKIFTDTTVSDDELEYLHRLS